MEKHMLKFIENKKAIMGLTFTQIGLIIATAILLSAAISLVFLNDWQKKSDLENIASSFSTIIQGMDTRFFENKTMYWFPTKEYDYDITTSTEFIVASSTGEDDEVVSHKERFLIKPWPRSANTKWMSGKELHEYLLTNYSHSGNESDPIPSSEIDNVKDELSIDRDDTNKTLALNPIRFDLNKPIYIEKIYIYYDKDDDGWNKTIDEKEDFVILYQK